METIDVKLPNYVKRAIKKNAYTEPDFISDGIRYINAIKEGRVICAIASVSESGMSRTIRFLECAKSNYEPRYIYLNFYGFMKCLGYKTAGKYGDYFRINGCGMDMIFATNHNIISSLYDMGFINKEQCDDLSQKTPTVI
jgi:hypothetical protein